MPARVVIVGAGFAGLPAARELARRIKEEVVLIDRRPFFQFSPRLIDALASHEPVPFFTSPLAPIAKRDGFRFIQGEVVEVDRRSKALLYRAGRKRTRLDYDLLVLATGCLPNDFGIPGVREHAFMLKTVEDVERIHERIRERLAEAKAKSKRSVGQRASGLTFAVIGGGTAGVEAAFALRRYVLDEAERTSRGLKKDVGFRLVEAGPDILRGLPEPMVRGATKELCRRGIALHLNDPVTRIEERDMMFASGDRLAAGCAIWTAGIIPILPATDPGFHLDRGCLVVDRALAAGPGLLAAGDAVCYRERNVMIPKNAQTALEMSLTLARNAERILRGGERDPFVYVNRGNLLTLQDTGYADVRLLTLKSRLVPWLRDRIYRWRFRQVTGNKR